MVWYSHFFQNFPQFIVIRRVKGFGIVNKAEIDVFLELSCFFDNPVDVGNLISGSAAFLKPGSYNIYIYIYEKRNSSYTVEFSDNSLLILLASTERFKTTKMGNLVPSVSI